MINKQSLWFLTLFSIILILAVYYISMPTTNLASLAASSIKNDEEEKETISIEDSDILASLRIESDEAVLAEMEDLQSILLNEKASTEEKNDAYEKLQNLNVNKGKEEELENLIKEKHNVESFVKIEQDKISVVVSKSEHNAKIANDIIRTVQEKFTEKMYITVKFQ